MLTELKIILRRSQSTLLQDAMGAAALMVMMVVALHVPGLT